jgi:hypothetical protein
MIAKILGIDPKLDFIELRGVGGVGEPLSDHA